MSEEIIVKLTQREYDRLTDKTTATGGIQVLIHRLQRGIRKTPEGWMLIVNSKDFQKIASYWKNTGGKPGRGGYQGRLPIRPLRQYLPSVAPLFDDGTVETEVRPWVYFKRQKLGGDGRIKIGNSGGEHRSRTGRSTDNPNLLVVLLRIRSTAERAERYWQRRFDHLRIRTTQEWFWPGDDLLEFIHETAAEQELSQQRRGDDAAISGGRPRGGDSTKREDP